MIDQLQALIEDIISDHWMKLAWFVIAAVGLGALKRWRDQRKWRMRQFLERVNCSLNLLDEGVLKIRTLFEMSLGEILLANQAAERLVVNAVQRTTKDHPFLDIAESERWFVYNACLNEISERYSAGLLAADMGVPVQKAWYIFALSCERDSDVRIQKIRILIVRETLLKQIDSAHLAEPSFESPTHHVRWDTLQQMAVALRENPGRFMRIELALPNAPRLERPAASVERTKPAKQADPAEPLAGERLQDGAFASSSARSSSSDSSTSGLAP